MLFTMLSTFLVLYNKNCRSHTNKYNDIGDVGGVVSHVGHIVAGEGAEDAGPLRGSHEPAVVALLHHVHDVSLAQLHLVIVLGLVVVQRAETAMIKIIHHLKSCAIKKYLVNLKYIWSSYGVGSGLPLDMEDPGRERVE